MDISEEFLIAANLPRLNPALGQYSLTEDMSIDINGIILVHEDVFEHYVCTLNTAEELRLFMAWHCRAKN